MATGENIDNILHSADSADLSVISLIISSDFVGKSVVFILLLTSIWSWAIIIHKYLKYKTVKQRMSKFEKLFWSGQVIDELFEKIKTKIDNPISVVFVGAIEEFRRNKGTTHKKSDNLRIGCKERINQTMYILRNREIESLETKLSFLATIGSSSVFIGLFGTVWGIIHSFQSIASAKNTSLAVVAPGIAEALVATAIGLFVAIPAVIFYNYLSSEIDTISNRVDDFVCELSKLLSRAIDEE